MNEQKKNELGNIYGSRISKNGKWLNLLIVTHVGGQEVRITCPVRMDENKVAGKPHAEIGADTGTQRCASICGVKVYEDKKPTEAQAKVEDSDLPF